jgi:hypothetical protein
MCVNLYDLPAHKISPFSNEAKIIALKSKVKYIFCPATILFYIIQKKLHLNTSCMYFPDIFT